VSAKDKKTKTAGPFEGLRGLRDELQKKEQERAKAGAPPRPPPIPSPPPKTSPRGAKRDEEEARLLRRAYAGVAPMDRDKGPRPRQPLEPSRPKDVEATPATALVQDAVIHDRLRALALGQSRFEVADEGDRVEGRRADVPLDVMRRLRRGQIPVDARLDLHGMSSQEARTALEAFLRSMRERNERMVLVIHGKGAHSPLGLPVLRGEVSAWLSQSTASEHVAAFATASQNDGGTGAVYVLLRR
jgi:DNA-nicking Smr family endonuclease